MKVLFQGKGNKFNLVDSERRIFKIDGRFMNEFGEEIQVEEKLYKREELNEYDEDNSCSLLLCLNRT